MVYKNFPKFPICGNTVLITGGSSGIGLAFARRFLQAGNQVIVTGRNAEKLANVQADYPEIITEVADMADLEALQKLVDRHPDVNLPINWGARPFSINWSVKLAITSTVPPAKSYLVRPKNGSP
ncbi:MAG: hypothetical protein Kow00121_11920 [Elainellaceae cyanobacterium]